MAVTDIRTAVDWAYQIKILLDEDYPQAIKVKLVMDNLNTHTPASLYKAFAPEEVGSTWPKSNSVIWGDNVWGGGFPTGKSCAEKWRPGFSAGIRVKQKWNGGSPLKIPESS